MSSSKNRMHMAITTHTHKRHYVTNFMFPFKLLHLLTIAESWLTDNIVVEMSFLGQKCDLGARSGHRYGSGVGVSTHFPLTDHNNPPVSYTDVQCFITAYLHIVIMLIVKMNSQLYCTDYTVPQQQHTCYYNHHDLDIYFPVWIWCRLFLTYVTELIVR